MIIRSGRVIGYGPVNKWDGYGNNHFEPAGNQVGFGTYKVKRVRVDKSRAATNLTH